MKNFNLKKFLVENRTVANTIDEAPGQKHYMKVDEGHCNEVMEMLKGKYASEGIKFSKEGKDTINAGHCTEAKMRKMVSDVKKEGYKVHESSCNSN